MPPAGAASVEVCHLTKHYGQTAAVCDLSLAVSPGEIFGLLGRNGAGKTTTLECILGLRQPDRGTIRIGGVDALAEPERARALVGAQLQSAALPDKLTPRQALRYFGAFYATPRPVGELLEEFDLGAKADTAFESLSGGQKQRLFLALAFVHQPPVLVLDEPTAGLDAYVRHQLHGMIAEARNRGLTLVLSTHDLDEAERLCDRIGIIHRGRLVACGTPADLIAAAPGKVRLAVRTREPLGVQTLRAGVGEPTSATVSGATKLDHWASWECTDVNEALSNIVKHLGATGNTLLDVRIQRPTLEQAFIQLTGSAWDEEVRHE